MKSPSSGTIYAALLVLAAATTAVAYVDLGAFNGPAALLIASAKTVLVALYFMHVRMSSPITKLFAGTAVFWVAILIVLTLSDVLTRDWMAPAAPPLPGEAIPKTVGSP